MAIELGTVPLRIVNIYAPNEMTSHADFFQNILEFVEGDSVLLGDFNSIILGKDRFSGKLDRTSELLGTILRDLEFDEIPGQHQGIFIYHHPSISERKSQLDRIYINFINKRLKGYASYASCSDYYLVGLFEIPLEDFGLKIWRFYSDILLDHAFGDRVQLACSNFGNENVCNEWEVLKGRF